MRYAHHERLRAYAACIAYVERIRERDYHLAMVIRGRLESPRADRPDGYPRGGDGGYSSGVSDPTGAAAEQREAQADRLKTHAEDAIAAVFEALRALVAADASCAKALEPPKASEVEVRRPDDAVWCISCLRERVDRHGNRVRGSVTAFEPRTLAAKRSRDDLCSWCLTRWETSSDDPTARELPDVRLAMWRADNPGRYLTERIAVEVLKKKQPA